MAYTPYVKVSGTWRKMTINWTEVVDGPTALSDLAEDSTSRHISDEDIASFGGGGTKEYASFYLTTGGTSSIGSTAKTMVINNTGINSNGDVFGLASNEVTVDKTAIFKIDANVYLNNSSTARSEYSLWLEKNGTEIPGSRFASYQRGYDSGMSSGVSLIVSVTSGDTFRIRCQITDGSATTGYQDNNGTRLTFLEV